MALGSWAPRFDDNEVKAFAQGRLVHNARSGAFAGAQRLREQTFCTQVQKMHLSRHATHLRFQIFCFYAHVINFAFQTEVSLEKEIPA